MIVLLFRPLLFPGGEERGIGLHRPGIVALDRNFPQLLCSHSRPEIASVLFVVTVVLTVIAITIGSPAENVRLLGYCRSWSQPPASRLLHHALVRGAQSFLSSPSNTRAPLLYEAFTHRIIYGHPQPPTISKAFTCTPHLPKRCPKQNLSETLTRGKKSIHPELVDLEHDPWTASLYGVYILLKMLVNPFDARVARVSSPCHPKPRGECQAR